MTLLEQKPARCPACDQPLRIERTVELVKSFDDAVGKPRATSPFRCIACGYEDPKWNEAFGELKSGA